MAQTADILLLSAERYAGKIPLFLGINNVRFLRKVLPGDTLEVHAKMASERVEKAIATCSAEAYVNGELAGTTVLETVEGTVTVSGTSAMILVKAADEEPEEELDLSELEELFALLEETDPEDYTEESVENVVNVLAEIIDALTNEELELTQEDIDAMADALREAIDALVPIGSETEPTEPETTEPETTAPEATTKPGTGDNVQTGDAFNMVWFAVLAVSAMATAALVAARKKLF
jgi:hypothetical protein